ncbi:MAG: HAD-IIIA family hydrolase [Patescibacteria group bacterium]|nr:HAD-IIIA family hydrolase [Patescibacteria group bacterium]MDE2015262.1 HAD-IIIA family hydrolase [Patescibacteria group bacterium]MDE2227068.1 HAD-IIIA family hydrolase [Patescibacteria group bacterium]
MVEKIKQAIILAGGPGMRMRPLTYDRPKLMVLVNGKPFLDYLIEMLKSQGITEIVILLGYLHKKITEYLGDGSRFGLKVRYWVGTTDNGTGTRIREAKDLFDDTFLLLYCDNFFHLNLRKLLDFHNAHDVLATSLVYTNKYGVTKNNIFVGDDGYVIKYDKKRQGNNLNGVDLGFFIFSKKIIDTMPTDNFYLDETTIPLLVAEKKLAGFMTDSLYYSLGSINRFEATERFLNRSRKIIFLDRDGVINKKMPPRDYVKRWEEFEFLPGAIEALRMLTESGYEIYIISNQAGVARGLMTEGDLFQIHKNMEIKLTEKGAKISAIYYCPHGWSEGCDCRKPKPGMFYRAAIDHQIDLPRTIFVGDDQRDVEAGNAAGCKKTFLVDSKNDLISVVKTLIR